MPNYPTGSQNLQLLEDLKEQYSQYLPGFQGGESSVVDFMKHLGTQGVEGMGHDKENRARLLGLNEPSSQRRVLPVGGAVGSQSSQPPPTMDYLNILTGQSPRGPRNDLETQNLSVAEIAPRPQEEIYESSAPEPNWGDGRFNLPELSPTSGAMSPNDLTSLLAEKFTPTKKELSTELFERIGSTDLGQQFDLGGVEEFAGMGFKEKLGSLFAKGQGKIGAMQTKLAPLDKKITDLIGKGSEISAKFAGPLEAAQMWAGGDKAGKATDKALKKVNEGFTNLHGMRGDAIQSFDAYMDIAEDQFKSTISQQASLANKTLKESKDKLTSNIGTGSIQKSARGVRDTLASGMKHTVDASKAKLDAAGLKGMSMRRSEMENITEATEDLKVVQKELKKKKKLEKLIGGVDKVVAGGTLALDFMTGGTAGSAVRGGYSIGKSFLGV